MQAIHPSPANYERRTLHKPAYSAAGSSLWIASALLAFVAGCHDKQSSQGATQVSQHLDFNQDVQPILASNCFSCHGPDPEMRKAGLRLDLEESAFKKRPGHPDAIVAATLRKASLSSASSRRTLTI